MRVPLSWLHEYCAPDLDTAVLAERLTMSGTKVEGIEHHGVGALENFVVGKVLAAEQHPDADRLRVCQVDTGTGEPSQIVCGAPNVAAGQTVAVARPGAIMPDGTKLKTARLRGQESHGMILAEDELAIGTDHDGIIVLDDGALAPGTPLAHVLPIAGEVLDLEITANRPDCLSVYGVAREVHAVTGAPLAPPPWAQDPGSDGATGGGQNDTFSPRRQLEGARITVEDPALCPRFTARLFEDVKIGPSPQWLKARLMAAGQRPISNVVDITNYVMLLTGQPLHAFDLDRVAGNELTVRLARTGEQVLTLDGQTRTLDDQMLLIADADGPTSIAGVMGGERSEVADDTTRVLMEAATWDGPNVHRTSWSLGLVSEASTRFEKGLQPEVTLQAQAVAAQLMIDLCGAQLVPGTIDVGGPGPDPVTIRLRDERVTGLLGAPIPRPRCAEILRSLEFTVFEAFDGLDVTVPTFRRGDVSREADLIEEVARLDGLYKLPATLPSRHGASGRLTPLQRLRRRAADALTAQGLDEAVGWSFVGPDANLRLRLGDQPAVALENPMSTEQSRLRTTLLGSLLDVVALNHARGATAVHVFETGAVYLPEPDAELPREPYRVGALLTGSARPVSWRDARPQPADFFAAKGVLAGLLDTLRADWEVQAATEPFLHPGRSARILIAGRPAGWLGEVHPLVAREWELERTIAGFELDLDVVAQGVLAEGPELYRDLLSFPPVHEDLAVIVSEQISAAEVLAVVREAGGSLLLSAEVFDVYRDAERIGEGNVSLALRLRFGAPERTLTDERGGRPAPEDQRRPGRARAGESP